MQHFDEASNPPHEHLVKYIKKPLTIIRISALVFSVIVFGCISSEGWHYDPAAGTRVCSVNSSYGTCQLAVTVAVLALLLGAALMAAEWFYDALPSSDARKQLVLADLVISGKMDGPHGHRDDSFHMIHTFMLQLCSRCSSSSPSALSPTSGASARSPGATSVTVTSRPP